MVVGTSESESRYPPCTPRSITKLVSSTDALLEVCKESAQTPPDAATAANGTETRNRVIRTIPVPLRANDW